MKAARAITTLEHASDTDKPNRILSKGVPSFFRTEVKRMIAPDPKMLKQEEMMGTIARTFSCVSVKSEASFIKLTDEAFATLKYA